MATHSEDPPLRPRIGGKRGEIKPQRVPTFRRSVLARLQLRPRHVAGAAPKRGSTPAAAHVREPPAFARRCLTKARVVPMSHGGRQAAALHLAYIEREGVERDGSKGELYGPSDVSPRKALEADLPGERHQFRFIVSPEDAGELDLREYTRALMAQVEADLGRRLIWGAVNHHDTDNPHVHVVIRGVDADGHQLRIDPGYIARGMRWRAQEIATRELGPRGPADLARQKDREVALERLTSLDREIAGLLGQDGTVELASALPPLSRSRLIGRLEVLKRLQLAARLSPRSWRLAPGWQEALRALGERGDIIKRIHAALPEAGDVGRYRVVDRTREHPPIEGVLRRRGLDDELGGGMYAVVEDAGGQAHYVRLDAATPASAREGAIVRVSTVRQSWANEMDAVLAQVATENGGIYDPRKHLEALRSRHLVIAGRKVQPEEVIAANLRRLARLARHRLVSSVNGQWRVPADLVAELRSRDLRHPRFRTQIAEVAPPLEKQVWHRGPVWLDRARADAPYGFGADLARARADRARFLGHLGIAGSPDEALRALGALERRDFGERLAAARGLSFVERPAPGFRGRLQTLDEGGAAPRFLAVVEESVRRLALVPATTSLRALIGQVVELESGDDGRPVVRRLGHARGT